MSRKLTKLAISLGTLICLTSLLTTSSRTQSVSSENCLRKPASTQSIRYAVEDSLVPKECEIWKNLTPITKDNPRLIWKGDRVLMVTFTRRGSCDSENKSLACKEIGG